MIDKDRCVNIKTDVINCDGIERIEVTKETDYVQV